MGYLTGGDALRKSPPTVDEAGECVFACTLDALA